MELKVELGFQTAFIKFDSELPEPAVEPITVDSGNMDTYDEPKPKTKIQEECFAWENLFERGETTDKRIKHD